MDNFAEILDEVAKMEAFKYGYSYRMNQENYPVKTSCLTT